jgi:RNA polymerase sigma factor (TIGR02999 family)
MSDVTRILLQIKAGDPVATDQLLPLVYDELRKLAAAKLAQEQPGHTLQATALVHEAYLRIVGHKDGQPESEWNSRGHFFAAAAEAMRRILVERARRYETVRRGGEFQRNDALQAELVADQRQSEVLRVDSALDALAEQDPRAAELVKLRFFVGMTNAEAADALGVSTRTVERLWVYAKAWLREALSD